jgi:hypothetical protein
VQVIAAHDGDARQDMLVNLQYLCAAAGYLAADYPGPASERDELLKHLHAFMQHVCDERAAGATPAPRPEPAATAPSVAGHSVPTADPAVGIWQPD